MPDEPRLKMYILVKEEVATGFALVAAAHAALAGYLRFQDHPDTQAWITGPFYKTICKVDAQAFEAAKAHEDHVVITESALGGQEVALAFRPRQEWPKAFKFYKLYR